MTRRRLGRHRCIRVEPRRRCHPRRKPTSHVAGITAAAAHDDCALALRTTSAPGRRRIVARPSGVVQLAERRPLEPDVGGSSPCPRSRVAAAGRSHPELAACRTRAMTERPLSAVVLAAGEGTRMRSDRPKPLHLLCGRAMLLYVLDALADCAVERVVVVVGHGAERVTKKLQDEAARPACSTSSSSTCSAAPATPSAVGLTALPRRRRRRRRRRVVLPGDTPLLRPDTVAALVAEHRETGAACTLLTARARRPDRLRPGRPGQGRPGRPHRRAASTPPTTSATIDEINTSIYCFRRSAARPGAAPAQPRQRPGRVLPDRRRRGARTTPATRSPRSWSPTTPARPQGVNDRVQLAAAEAELRRRTNERWLRAGRHHARPRAHLHRRHRRSSAADVTLFPGTILQGRTVVGAGAEIGPDTRLVDCIVGAGAVVEQISRPRRRDRRRRRRRPVRRARARARRCRPGRVTGPFYTALGSRRR